MIKSLFRLVLLCSQKWGGCHLKKVFRNRKGLSPVVAAVILIGVTVAVSVAVASWMGSLSSNYIETKELSIVDVDFIIGDTSAGRIVVNVKNIGTGDVTVHRIDVNGKVADVWSSEKSDTVDMGSAETFTITQVVSKSTKYGITMYSTDGTLVGSIVDTA